MPFSEPTIGAGAYTFGFVPVGQDPMGFMASFDVTLNYGGVIITEAEVDVMAQAFIDFIAAAPQYEFRNARKALNGQQIITPTPPA